MKFLRLILVTVVLVSVIALVYLSYDSVAQLSKRTPPLTDNVVRGKEAWQRNNCINCHTILGNGAYFAPDLTKVAVKRSGKWLTSFLTSPKKVWPGTAMSNMKLSPQDAQDLTAFLTWVKDVDTNGWPPKPLITNQNSGTSAAADTTSNIQSSARSIDKDSVKINGNTISVGKRVFDSEGCSGCHRVNGAGGSVGPDLTTVGKVRSPEWLKSFLQNPQKVKPNTMMTAPDVSGESLDALVDYLGSLK